MSNFYNEILTDHNMHPVHKHELAVWTCSREGVNPSCGDDITLNLRIEDGIIADGSFTGSGCAVSQASADIMLDLVIGKSIDDSELEELDEAAALADISHMPARVKCAVLGWRTLGESLPER